MGFDDGVGQQRQRLRTQSCLRVQQVVWEKSSGDILGRALPNESLRRGIYREVLHCPHPSLYGAGKGRLHGVAPALRTAAATLNHAKLLLSSPQPRDVLLFRPITITTTPTCRN